MGHYSRVVLAGALTPDQMSLLRGRRYNRAKKTYSEAGALKSRDQIDPGRTADRLAKEHGISAATIKRDGKPVDDASSSKIKSPLRASYEAVFGLFDKNSFMEV